MSETLPCNEDFQLALLHIILTDKQAVNKLQRFQAIDNLFEDDLSKTLVQIVFGFVEKYNNLPNFNQIINELENKGHLNVDRAVRMATELEVSSPEYYTDKISDYIYEKEFRSHVLKTANFLDADDFESAQKTLQDIAKLSKQDDAVGINFFENIDHEYTEDTSKIPTTIDALDGCLNGGIGIGELGLIMAPPGTGKSMSLVFLGAQAVLKGYSVVHFTFELSGEKTMMRYEAAFTKIPRMELKQRKSEVITSLNTLKKEKSFSNNLYIAEYPTKSCTSAMLEAHIEDIISANEKPDLIIVDYLDILKWSPSLEKRDGLGENAEQLRRLASKYKVPLWSATQANRASIEKIIFGMENIAESFEKAMVTDIILAICQTKDEVKSNMWRYFVAKNRNGVAGMEIEIEYDLDIVDLNMRNQAI